MKFSKLFVSLLFILAAPLVLLADNIKSDKLSEGKLVTNHGHETFFSDSDEHPLNTPHNLESSLNFACTSEDGSDVDNNVHHVGKHRKVDPIKTKKGALSNHHADCEDEQPVPDPVLFTPPIDRDDSGSDTTSTSVPEPASLLLLGAGLLTLVGGSRRRLLGN